MVCMVAWSALMRVSKSGPATRGTLPRAQSTTCTKAADVPLTRVCSAHPGGAKGSSSGATTCTSTESAVVRTRTLSPG